MHRPPSVLDAPSNLGLRPPAPGVAPGCYKLAGALRDHRLLPRIGAEDAGCATPPRYDRGDWEPGRGVFNAEGLAAYSTRLAGRVGALLDAGRFPVVLGGDCGILLGAALGLRRRDRYGLAFLDGHSDFRHPDNSAAVGAAAGEDLALATGRGQADLTDLEGRRPYFLDEDVAVIGIRDDDEYTGELDALGMAVWAVGGLRSEGPEGCAASALAHLDRPELDGFWLHLDADVLDAAVMPAVDSPNPGGLSHAELGSLLGALLASERCVGMEVTVFDPDLDPDGRLAGELTDTLVAAFARRLSPAPQGGGSCAARRAVGFPDPAPREGRPPRGRPRCPVRRSRLHVDLDPAVEAHQGHVPDGVADVDLHPVEAVPARLPVGAAGGRVAGRGVPLARLHVVEVIGIGGGLHSDPHFRAVRVDRAVLLLGVVGRADVDLGLRDRALGPHLLLDVLGRGLAGGGEGQRQGGAEGREQAEHPCSSHGSLLVR